MKISANSSTGCQFLREKKQVLVEDIYHEILHRFPQIKDKFGDEGLKRTREDIVFHLYYLETAVCLNTEGLFHDYVAWIKSYFNSIKLPESWTLETFAIINAIVRSHDNNNQASQVIDYIDKAIKAFPDMPAEVKSFMGGDNKLNVLANQYLASLLRRDRLTAEKLIMNAVDDGLSVKEIYLEVFQPAQWEIGRMWQLNEISVAMEHYFTASTQFIMSRLYPHIFTSKKNGRHLVATSVSGELHELGIRMVADLFEMEGWSTVYLGANTPDSAVVDMIRETKADLLAVSATIPYNLPQVSALNELVRSSFDGRSPKIIVGGKAFSGSRELWKEMNADGFAVDALTAIEVASEMLN